MTLDKTNTKTDVWLCAYVCIYTINIDVYIYKGNELVNLLNVKAGLVMFYGNPATLTICFREQRHKQLC